MQEDQNSLANDVDSLLEQGRQDAAAKSANSQGPIKPEKSRQNASHSRKQDGSDNRQSSKPTTPRGNGSVAQQSLNDRTRTPREHKERDLAEFDRIETYASCLGLQGNVETTNASTGEGRPKATNPTEKTTTETNLDGSALTFKPANEPTSSAKEHQKINSEDTATESKTNSRNIDVANPTVRTKPRPEPLEPQKAPVRRGSPQSSSLTSSFRKSVNIDSPGYQGLEEWLELTGFHDRPYRQRTLDRFGRQKEIEAQQKELEAKLASLKKEINEDVETGPYVMRPQSVHSQLKSEDTSPKSMGPPPLPDQRRASGAWDSSKPATSTTVPERPKRGSSLSWDADLYERVKQPRWERAVDDPSVSSRSRLDRQSPPRRAESARPSSSYYPNYQSRRSQSPHKLPLERRVSGPLNTRYDDFDRRDSTGFQSADHWISRSYDRHTRFDGGTGRAGAKHFRGSGRYRKP